jgi:hypothetical protein
MCWKPETIEYVRPAHFGRFSSYAPLPPPIPVTVYPQPSQHWANIVDAASNDMCKYKYPNLA